MIGGQQAQGEGQGKDLFPAREQQTGFSEGSQAFPLGGQFGGGAGGIQLNHLPAGGVSGVPDFDGYGQVRALQRGAADFGGKGGIGKPVSERIPGFQAESIEIPVAHPDAFGVELFRQLAVPVGESCGGRIIFIFICVGIRQPAGRADFSGEYIRDGVSALAAGLGDQNQSGNLQRIRKGKVDDAADVQQNDQGEAEGSKGFQIRFFLIAQIIVTLFRMPVREFTGNP